MPKPKLGRYIVLEGGEAVGKTTQVELLAKRLTNLGLSVRDDIREPGGTPMAEAIREVLMNSSLDRKSVTNLLLFNAIRSETLSLIEQEVQAGSWVISDRSYFSTLAYQGYGEQLPLETVRTICQETVGSRQPDLMMVLELNDEARQSRLQEREADDYFETKGDKFHQRVLSGYQKEAERLNLPIIDGCGTVHEVHERIWKHVKPLT